eukprot:115010-Rhodomonas_salina.1
MAEQQCGTEPAYCAVRSSRMVPQTRCNQYKASVWHSKRGAKRSTEGAYGAPNGESSEASSSKSSFPRRFSPPLLLLGPCNRPCSSVLSRLETSTALLPV